MRRSLLIGFTALVLVFLQLFPSAAMDDTDSSKDRPTLKLDWPVLGPVSISRQFGRQHFYSEPCSFHAGIDISAPEGKSVYAAAPGEVLYAGWLRGFGQVVIIDHGHNYSTVYAHMSYTRVKKGKRVTTGTVIGAVGNTGGATAGYHLHFEVREGETMAKNPLKYLRSKKMCE